MPTHRERTGSLSRLLIDLVLALMLLSTVTLVLFDVRVESARRLRNGRKPAGIVEAIGIKPVGPPSADGADTQRSVTKRLRQSGAVDDSAARLADQVGKHAAALGEKLNATPEGREKALKQVNTMTHMVRKSSMQEIKQLLVDDAQLRALSDPRGDDIDVEHAKIESVRKVVEDGKPVMIIVLVDPHNRRQELRVTDPEEQKQYEHVHRIYKAADRNPVFKAGLDIANHFIQMKEKRAERQAAARKVEAGRQKNGKQDGKQQEKQKD